MKRYLLIASTFLALVSCSKDVTSLSDETSNGTYFTEGQQVTLTCGHAQTKVSGTENAYKGIDFKWEDGDKIKVSVGDASSEFTLTGEAGGTTATFIGTMPASGSTFKVQYPVDNPDITTQTYIAEALPYKKMKFAKDNCSLGSAIALEAHSSALRLNVYGTNQTISKIVVTNTTESGTYTLTISGGKKLSSDSSNPTPFLIVVPTGSYNFSAEVFDNASTPESICSFKTTSVKTFIASKILNMTAQKVEKNFALSGVFSVSASSKVKFSKGNLYYTGSEFKFEDNQYSYQSTYQTNHVSHFRWAHNSGTLSTDITSAIGTESLLSGSTSDVFFTNAMQKTPRTDFTVEGQAGKWRTLSGGPWQSLGEWEYLLNERTGDKAPDINGNTDCRYACGKVNNICGMLIFPDTFTWPAGVSYPSKFNDSESNWNSYNYSVEQFTLLENAGCVFLPAAGLRYTDSSIMEYGESGCYSSSTPYSDDNEYAHYLLFKNNVSAQKVVPYDKYYRSYGFSVRLVCSTN